MLVNPVTECEGDPGTTRRCPEVPCHPHSWCHPRGQCHDMPQWYANRRHRYLDSSASPQECHPHQRTRKTPSQHQREILASQNAVGHHLQWAKAPSRPEKGCQHASNAPGALLEKNCLQLTEKTVPDGAGNKISCGPTSAYGRPHMPMHGRHLQWWRGNGQKWGEMDKHVNSIPIKENGEI